MGWVGARMGGARGRRAGGGGDGGDGGPRCMGERPLVGRGDAPSIWYGLCGSAPLHASLLSTQILSPSFQAISSWSFLCLLRFLLSKGAASESGLSYWYAFGGAVVEVREGEGQGEESGERSTQRVVGFRRLGGRGWAGEGG